MSEETETTFRPTLDRVLVKRAERVTMRGSLILPPIAQEEQQLAEIVAVGPGALNNKGERLPMSVAAGDRVMLGKWSGSEVKIGGVEMLIVREGDILGVVEEAPQTEAAAA